MRLYLQPGQTGSWQTVLPFAWTAGAEMTNDDGRVHVRQRRRWSRRWSTTSRSSTTASRSTARSTRRARDRLRRRADRRLHLRTVGHGLVEDAGRDARASTPSRRCLARRRHGHVVHRRRRPRRVQGRREPRRRLEVREVADAARGPAGVVRDDERPAGRAGRVGGPASSPTTEAAGVRRAARDAPVRRRRSRTWEQVAAAIDRDIEQVVRGKTSVRGGASRSMQSEADVDRHRTVTPWQRRSAPTAAQARPGGRGVGAAPSPFVRAVPRVHRGAGAGQPVDVLHRHAEHRPALRRSPSTSSGSTTTPSCSRTRCSARPPRTPRSTSCSACRSRWCSRWPPRSGSTRITRLRGLLPGRLLPAGRDQHRRRRGRVAVPAAARRRPDQHGARLGRHRRARLARTPRRWAMPSLIVMAAWRNLGTLMVIFLAGLQTVPQGPARGGRGRRRQRLAAVPPHHAADAAADPALRRRDHRHRLPPVLRGAVRDDPGRAAGLAPSRSRSTPTTSSASATTATPSAMSYGCSSPSSCSRPPVPTAADRRTEAAMTSPRQHHPGRHDDHAALTTRGARAEPPTPARRRPSGSTSCCRWASC